MANAEMSADLSLYPGIDWDSCLRLTDNNEKLARDLLKMFVDTLPEEMNVLNKAYEEQDFTAVKKQAHKIHGALCYCSIPKMKVAMLNLEKACIAADEEGIFYNLRTIRHEAETLLAYVQHM